MKAQLIAEVKMLDRIRASHEWSREKLAFKLGVHSSSIVRWEKGISRPRNLSLQQIRKLIKDEERKLKKPKKRVLKK